jgi:transcription initiation factor TFIIIB Brf1 subunit/transcription initiation factor TFIIB
MKNLNKDLIGISPSYNNNRPSHCPKCGSTGGFSKDYYLGMQTDDYICGNCNICIETYSIPESITKTTQD